MKGLENIENNSIVFVSNYFGLSDESQILKLLENEKNSGKNIVVIYDITQSLFATKNSSVVDFFVASARKWLPIPDGAFVSCDQKFDADFERTPNEMVKNFVHASVLKFFKKKTGYTPKEYRKLFVEAEEKLSQLKGFKQISEYSENYINNFDFSVLGQRKQNYNQLLKLLNNKNITPCFNEKIKGEKIPFTMPILCKNRDDLRCSLMQNQVYCAIHWNQDFMPNEAKNKDYSEQILSIPIDERYSTEDMKVLAKILNKFGR